MTSHPELPPGGVLPPGRVQEPSDPRFLLRVKKEILDCTRCDERRTLQWRASLPAVMSPTTCSACAEVGFPRLQFGMCLFLGQKTTWHRGRKQNLEEGHLTSRHVDEHRPTLHAEELALPDQASSLLRQGAGDNHVVTARKHGVEVRAKLRFKPWRLRTGKQDVSCKFSTSVNDVIVVPSGLVIWT